MRAYLFVLASVCLLFSCRLDTPIVKEKTEQKKKVVTKKAPSSTKPPVNETINSPSSSTAGSRSKIDYKNINLTLLENLIHEEIN